MEEDQNEKLKERLREAYQKFCDQDKLRYIQALLDSLSIRKDVMGHIIFKEEEILIIKRMIDKELHEFCREEKIPFIIFNKMLIDAIHKELREGWTTKELISILHELQRSAIQLQFSKLKPDKNEEISIA